MPTLRFATGLPQGLRFAEETKSDADRPLRGVHPLSPDKALDDGQVRHHLVVVRRCDPRLGERDRLNRFLARLTATGAAALAIALPPGTETQPSVRAAARHHGMPLLTVGDDPPTWFQLHSAIVDEYHARTLRTATLHRQLLEQIHHLGGPEGIQRLVTWLAGFAGAQVAVVPPLGSTCTVAPAGAGLLLDPAREKVAQLSSAGQGWASLELADLDPTPGTADLQIRLFRIGAARPAPVLAVGAPAFSPDTNIAIARTLDLLAVQTAAEAAARGNERLRRAEESVRQAILQLLMTGNVTEAQRTARCLIPGILDVDECQVFILKSRRTERTSVIQDCLEAVGSATIVSACPAFSDQVVVIAPGPSTEYEAMDGLTAVVRAAPHRYLGASTTRQLADTAQAYGDASRALVVAQRTSTRIHQYTADVQLAHILDERADTWAHARLAPLLGLPESRREQLLATLRLGLDFTPAAAARILGTHRNTVARRLSAAAGLLEADLQDIIQRAVLGLALELGTRAERAPALHEPTGIAQVLDTDEVRCWASEFLEPLSRGRRHLIDTLSAWIEANTHIETTAAALDLNPATVRSHLRQAQNLIQRRLVSGSTADEDLDLPGAHDVVLALAVLPEMPIRL
ncbi:helix-turn-helix domain-containing protein [Kitasatospora sp. NPDC054768]|uniref:helix-turn-helix domain-containing protein n=1 Tax=Kitasatospora sp. NBC_01519 TaxID=2903576 RepID=UPI002F91B4A9